MVRICATGRRRRISSYISPHDQLGTRRFCHHATVRGDRSTPSLQCTRMGTFDVTCQDNSCAHVSNALGTASNQGARSKRRRIGQCNARNGSSDGRCSDTQRIVMSGGANTADSCAPTHTPGQTSLANFARLSVSTSSILKSRDQRARVGSPEQRRRRIGEAERPRRRRLAGVHHDSSSLDLLSTVLQWPRRCRQQGSACDPECSWVAATIG